MYLKRIYQRVWWKEWQWKETFESGYLLPTTFKGKKSLRVFGTVVKSFFLAQMIAGSSPVRIIFYFYFVLRWGKWHLFALRKLQIKESFTILSLSHTTYWTKVFSRRFQPKNTKSKVWQNFNHFGSLKNMRNQVHRNIFLFLRKDTQSLNYFYWSE